MVTPRRLPPLHPRCYPTVASIKCSARRVTICSARLGDVLTVEFTLMGAAFVGLNGGPHFKFNEAVSFHPVDTQVEIAV